LLDSLLQEIVLDFLWEIQALLSGIVL